MELLVNLPSTNVTLIRFHTKNQDMVQIGQGKHAHSRICVSSRVLNSNLWPDVWWVMDIRFSMFPIIQVGKCVKHSQTGAFSRTAKRQRLGESMLERIVVINCILSTTEIQAWTSEKFIRQQKLIFEIKSFALLALSQGNSPFIVGSPKKPVIRTLGIFHIYLMISTTDCWSNNRIIRHLRLDFNAGNVKL